MDESQEKMPRHDPAAAIVSGERPRVSGPSQSNGTRMTRDQGTRINADQTQK
jgi:hypothetical protein